MGGNCRSGRRLPFLKSRTLLEGRLDDCPDTYRNRDDAMKRAGTGKGHVK